ncbi:MAG: transcription termination/antitermination protein NusG [Nitrospinaceae bacterium]
MADEENSVNKEENAVPEEEGSATQEENNVIKEEKTVVEEEKAVAQAVVEEEVVATPEEDSVPAAEESAAVEEDSMVVEQDSAKQWYVIHTYSGFENKVKLSLEDRFAHEGLTDKLGDIVIPVEEVVEIRGGKKKISSRKFYPGYVLINVEMDQDIWYLIKNTSKVTGFPGGASPAPLTAAEVKDVMDQIKGEAKAPKQKFIFEKGENVRVIEGPFMNFNGVVEEVNPDKGKVKVMVSIFGRATPVEL